MRRSITPKQVNSRPRHAASWRMNAELKSATRLNSEGPDPWKGLGARRKLALPDPYRCQEGRSRRSTLAASPLALLSRPVRCLLPRRLLPGGRRRDA